MNQKKVKRLKREALQKAEEQGLSIDSKYELTFEENILEKGHKPDAHDPSKLIGLVEKHELKEAFERNAVDKMLARYETKPVTIHAGRLKPCARAIYKDAKKRDAK